MHYRNIFEKHYHDMDKFVHVWDGGCRAGGAAWKSKAYTRKGLTNVKQLKVDLDLSDDERKAKMHLKLHLLESAPTNAEASSEEENLEKLE